VVGPAAVEEEAEAVDGEQVAEGALAVRAAQRRHLHRRPHPLAGGDGEDGEVESGVRPAVSGGASVTEVGNPAQPIGSTV
jgi:hypothetical protein